VTCDRSQLDAAYVLGALSPEERLEFERHLPGCPACSRAVGALAGLPGLLAQVSPEVLDSAPVNEPVPDTLLPALVGQVRRERARRRWLTGAAAAAVVLALGAGSVVVQGLDEEGPPSTSPTPTATPSGRTMTQVGQDSVLAEVALTSVAWGTRLDLTCSYAEHDEEYGGDVGSTYALVVRSVDGDVEQVATWRGLPGRTMTLTGATSLRREDISAVQVRARDGHAVLELTG
jgi:hypothetical protein